MNAQTIVILTTTLLGALAAGDCLGQGRSIDDVRAAETHVRSIFAAYGKALSAQRDMITVDVQAKAAQVAARDTVLDYQYSPLPKAEITRRYGQSRIVISDGWVYMMREMLRSALVAQADNSVQALSCTAAYKKALLEIREHNQKAAQARRGRLRAIPAFADFVQSGKPEHCSRINVANITSAQVEKQLLDSEDALLVWLLGWQWHLQYDAAMPYYPANETDAERACACGEQTARKMAEKFSRNVLKKNLALAATGIQLHEALFPSTCLATIQ